MQRDLPVSFSRPLIRPIKLDLKTQTRRIMQPQPPVGYDVAEWVRDPSLSVRFENAKPPLGMWTKRCPFGDVGDLLWVREDYKIVSRSFRDVRVQYLADDHRLDVTLTEAEAAKLDARRSPLTKPQPGRFLFKSCTRLWLEVAGVRVERLQSITEEDAIAEGARLFDFGKGRHGEPLIGWHMIPEEGEKGPDHVLSTARFAFANLWNKLHGETSWRENPWVWVVGFRRTERKAVAA